MIKELRQQRIGAQITVYQPLQCCFLEGNPVNTLQLAPLSGTRHHRGVFNHRQLAMEFLNLIVEPGSAQQLVMASNAVDMKSFMIKEPSKEFASGPHFTIHLSCTFCIFPVQVAQ